MSEEPGKIPNKTHTTSEAEPKGYVALSKLESAAVEAYQNAFGETTKAYGKGTYSQKSKASLLELIASNEYTEHVSKEMKRNAEALLGVLDDPHKEALTGDTLVKDMTMIVLQPISLAIEGSMQAVHGLIQVVGNIIPAIKQSDDSQMQLAMAKTMLGVGILLLAAIAPVARLYNAMTRAYTTKVELDDAAENKDLAAQLNVPEGDLDALKKGGVVESLSQNVPSIFGLSTEGNDLSMSDEDEEVEEKVVVNSTAAFKDRVVRPDDDNKGSTKGPDITTNS